MDKLDRVIAVAHRILLCFIIVILFLYALVILVSCLCFICMPAIDWKVVECQVPQKKKIEDRDQHRKHKCIYFKIRGIANDSTTTKKKP